MALASFAVIGVCVLAPPAPRLVSESRSTPDVPTSESFRSRVPDAGSSDYEVPAWGEAVLMWLRWVISWSWGAVPDPEWCDCVAVSSAGMGPGRPWARCDFGCGAMPGSSECETVAWPDGEAAPVRGRAVRCGYVVARGRLSAGCALVVASPLLCPASLLGWAWRGRRQACSATGGSRPAPGRPCSAGGAWLRFAMLVFGLAREAPGPGLGCLGCAWAGLPGGLVVGRRPFRIRIGSDRGTVPDSYLFRPRIAAMADRLRCCGVPESYVPRWLGPGAGASLGLPALWRCAWCWAGLCVDGTVSIPEPGSGRMRPSPGWSVGRRCGLRAAVPAGA